MALKEWVAEEEVAAADLNANFSQLAKDAGVPVGLLLGENITAPQAAFIAKPSKLEVLNTGSARNLGDDTTNYRSQSFVTPSDMRAISAIVTKLHKDGTLTGNITLDLYASSGDNPTGASLGQATIVANSLTASGVDYTFTFSAPITVTPNTKYVFVLFYNGDASNKANITDSNTGYADGVESYSNNGSSWTAQTGYDMYFKIIGANGVAGRVYKSDANDLALAFFDGFVTASGSAGGAAELQQNGVVGGFSSLELGNEYYIQNDGTIGLNKGSAEIKVGKAISATEILIIRGAKELLFTDAISGSNASTTATDSSRIPRGTRYIIYDAYTYRYEGGITGSAIAQIVLIPGLITSFSIDGISATIVGELVNCAGMAGGGGATGYILGNMHYFT